jgi:hypothetical protein
MTIGKLMIIEEEGEEGRRITGACFVRSGSPRAGRVQQPQHSPQLDLCSSLRLTLAHTLHEKRTLNHDQLGCCGIRIDALMHDGM